MEINLLKCDVCDRVMKSVVNSKSETLHKEIRVQVDSWQGIVCSLHCLVVAFTKAQKTTPTDKDIIENLQKVFPKWSFTSPNYEEEYNARKLAEVKEAMVGLRGWVLMEKPKENNKGEDN